MHIKIKTRPINDYLSYGDLICGTLYECFFGSILTSTIAIRVFTNDGKVSVVSLTGEQIPPNCQFRKLSSDKVLEIRNT